MIQPFDYYRYYHICVSLTLLMVVCATEMKKFPLFHPPEQYYYCYYFSVDQVLIGHLLFAYYCQLLPPQYSQFDNRHWRRYYYFVGSHRYCFEVRTNLADEIKNEPMPRLS